MLQFAFTLYIRSSSCYQILLDSGTIILPQPRNLQKLSAVLSFSPGLQPADHEQTQYLKFKADSLSQREKTVVLQVDEMHVMQGLQYRGGRITGTADNSEQQADSIQAFLISSLAGSLRDIVALVPVKQLTATDLRQMIMKVISIVQTCGFVVAVVASDNNQINAKAFEELCDSSDMSCGFLNPDFPNQTIFVVFDTVHILKCIRNNWLDQKDSAQTFTYPVLLPVSGKPVSERTVTNGHEQGTQTERFMPLVVPVFVNDIVVPLGVVMPMTSPQQSPLHKASMECLKSQYASERCSLVKAAPGLRYKALYPTNLERQKVSLVLGIFNEKTVEVLLSKCNENTQQTAEFIAVILRWWKVMNAC